MIPLKFEPVDIQAACDFGWRGPHFFANLFDKGQRFEGKGAEKSMTRAELKERMDTTVISGHALQSGFDLYAVVATYPILTSTRFSPPYPLTIPSTEVCSFDLKIQGARAQWKLKTPHASVHQALQLPASMTLTTAQIFDSRWIEQAYLEIDSATRAHLRRGQEYRQVRLNFADQLLSNVMVETFVCLQDGCAKWTLKDQALNYRCQYDPILVISGNK